MKSKAQTKRVKPFRLVKYFSYSSLVVIFAGTLILSVLNTHWARTMQLEKSEEYARLLIENLNHQIFLQFVLPAAMTYGKIQLSNSEQYRRLDRVVKNTLHSFHVDKVTIYDKTNTVVYSFEDQLVGKKSIGGSGYIDALQGKLSSKVIQRGSRWEIMLGIPKEGRLVTIAPFRAERKIARPSGPVLGVIEIVQDLTNEYLTIFEFQIRVMASIAFIMVGLFLILLLIVTHGEKMSEQRAQERLRLKEQLNRAEHLSSLGEMVAGVSHEIRNPLGIIMSSAELLKRKTTGSDADNPIPNIIAEEAGRLNSIITDFLNYARPQKPDVRPCHVEEIIEKNIQYLSTQTSAQGYQLMFEPSEPLPEVSADANMLYQAFLNILLNGMQAMPDGGDIRISARRRDQQVEICFDDFGDGIPDELVEKIWDPFFTTKDNGSGLGLGIVKNIVRVHGGEIRIENRHDGGARVAIELPIHTGVSDGHHSHR